MIHAVTSPPFAHFLCNLEDVVARIDAIDPRAYDRTRNYLDGATTWLSPFLTHGVVDTCLVAERVLAQHRTRSCYRLLFELAWREYFHRQWQLHGDAIFGDLQHPQQGVIGEQPPSAILDHDTGIGVIDAAIERLLSEGTLHNHARMWIAGITCNLAGTAWPAPARWMHYHLLDGDLASNTLSWQWIAGTASSRRYLANQDNIDRYSRSRQANSVLDVSYEALERFAPPDRWLQRRSPDLVSRPPGEPITRLVGRVTLRSHRDLDPRWRPHGDATADDIVFIDTALDERFPMSPRRWQLVEHWARLCHARLCHGTVEMLRDACQDAAVIRRECPATRDWPGDIEERRWLYPLPEENFDSFSQYWKRVRGHVGL